MGIKKTGSMGNTSNQALKRGFQLFHPISEKKSPLSQTLIL